MGVFIAIAIISIPIRNTTKKVQFTPENSIFS